MEEIHRLKALASNWDSYGALCVDPNIIERAEELLLTLVQPETPWPTIVPTARGGIEIEWHTRGIDLEINFSSANQVSVSFENLRASTEWERDLSFADYKPLIEVVTTLSGNE